MSWKLSHISHKGCGSEVDEHPRCVFEDVLMWWILNSGDTPYNLATIKSLHFMFEFPMIGAFMHSQAICGGERFSAERTRNWIFVLGVFVLEMDWNIPIIFPANVTESRFVQQSSIGPEAALVALSLSHEMYGGGEQSQGRGNKGRGARNCNMRDFRPRENCGTKCLP